MSVKSRMDKVRCFMVDFTSNRPLCFLSSVGGARDFLIGLGFILGLSQIKQTHLFQNFNALIPGFSGPAVGWILLLVGLAVTIAAMVDNEPVTKAGLRVQQFLWLFSAFMYFLSGDIILGLVFGVFFSIPAGYLAFYYKHSPLWAAQKRRFQDVWNNEPDMLTGRNQPDRIEVSG